MDGKLASEHSQRRWWSELYGLPPRWEERVARRKGPGDRPDIDLVTTETVDVMAAPRLLVVDDEPDIRLWLSLTLRPGWAVEEAATGAEALDLVASWEPDVVVLDQRMHPMTGLECAALLRERGVDVPILLFSAFVDAESVREAQRLDVMPVSKVEHRSLLTTLEVLRSGLTAAPRSLDIDLTGPGRVEPHISSRQ